MTRPGNGKDMADLVRRAQKQGWTWERRGSHQALRSPSGEAIFMASTPSDRRTLRNIKATLRRHGMRF